MSFSVLGFNDALSLAGMCGLNCGALGLQVALRKSQLLLDMDLQLSEIPVSSRHCLISI